MVRVKRETMEEYSLGEEHESIQAHVSIPFLFKDGSW
jgi:hypothetical protein